MKTVPTGREPTDRLSLTSIQSIEWLGSASGIAGALLLALNTDWSRYGWPIFLASNGFWICYAYRLRIKSMLAMQMVFTMTSLLGIYRWLL